jgi:hypothetical protein
VDARARRGGRRGWGEADCHGELDVFEQLRFTQKDWADMGTHAEASGRDTEIGDDSGDDVPHRFDRVESWIKTHPFNRGEWGKTN